MSHTEIVEATARAMCVASGKDPESEVIMTAADVFKAARGEDVMLQLGYGPAWRSYTQQARQFIAARSLSA
ncbi:hypothetical protein [Breoghania sp.]|uniref:hypothetical protein n=1 Tax=Breoghania sp. TaxID=2065378 RepID=UPI0029C9C093|nr:hypothetical protein [Breoghania sp.]